MDSPRLPQTFGRYEVLRRLGKGAVGEVFLARDPALGREVAVKTLGALAGLPHGEQQEARARFLREAQAAAALSHPNIVTIFDVGEHEDCPYLAMEYLRGTTLDRHTREGHLLPAPKVVELGIQAALALDEAHRAGIVHRDVKPANMVLMQDGSLKVADFGLAKDIRTSLTSADTLLGTPNYMSPEQVAGRPLDGRSDLFSLGVSIYELLTGTRPFSGDTVSSVLYRIVNERHRPLAELRPDLPAALGEVIDRVLAKEPEQRQGSGNELAHELGAVLEGMGGVPRDLVIPAPAERSVPRADAAVTTAGRNQPPSRRRGRGLRWLTVLALLLLIAGVGWTLPLWGGADPLGQYRRPVEERLSAWLGPVGDALRITAPERVVQVSTEPPGLALRVDGGELGEDGMVHIAGTRQAPVRVVVDDRCRDGSVEIDPAAAGAPLLIRTTARSARLPLASSPPGARVSLDGARTEAKTPTEIEVELCRDHEVVLELPGRPPRELVLAGSESAEEWRARLGEVEIARAPDAILRISGCTEYPVRVIDARSGGRLGNAGQTIRVRPGDHRLRLSSREVFFEQDLRIEARPGETTRARVNCLPLGQLAVVSVPPDAEVRVVPLAGGKARSVGRTPLAGLSLVRGDYRVEIVHPASGALFRQDVSILGGKSARVRAGKGRGGW